MRMLPTALITGATRGIGFEIARQLAGQGMHVVIGARMMANGEEAAAMIKGRGGAASVLQLDVRESTSIQAAAHAFSRIVDRLDVLVNNAGNYPSQDGYGSEGGASATASTRVTTGRRSSYSDCPGFTSLISILTKSLDAGIVSVALTITLFRKARTYSWRVLFLPRHTLTMPSAAATFFAPS